MLDRAEKVNAKSIVYTFLNHPTSIFAPERLPNLLMTAEERKSALLKIGVNEVAMREFTTELAGESPSQFAEYLRATYPELDTVFCGPNWTFGAGGKGNADFLREHGFNVVTVPFEIDGDEPISSTRIRNVLKKGDIAEANRLLGHTYSVSGNVISGKGLGRNIGFPTLNITFAEENHPVLPFGVYEVSTHYGRGIANWGLAPTMGEQAWKSPVLEIHILKANNGESPHLALENATRIKTDFLRFIREERKFSSLEELKKQISADISSVSPNHHPTGTVPG